jgi:hypothetical protein
MSLSTVVVLWTRQKHDRYEIVIYRGVSYLARREDLEYIGHDYCRIYKDRLVAYK